jgi:hypothetical protein
MVSLAAGLSVCKIGRPWRSSDHFRFFALILSSHRAGASRRILGQGGGANRRRNAMRLLMVAMAAALLAVSAAPAHSQVSQMGMGNSSSMGRSSPKPPPEDKKNEKTPAQKKAEEKAYNDAINRIPDAKFDPWRTVR